MTNIRLPSTTRNALADFISDLIDGGAGSGVIRLYTASQPASADTAISTQVLLAEIPFADPSAPAASSGIVTFDVDPVLVDTAANNGGVVTWARIVDSNDNTIFDCDVATSGATLTIDNATIVAGAPVRVISFTLTMPAS
ncbi:MAG: hypothetical protein ACREQL_09390 [Candidatus Binatia bacterium]